MTSETTPDGCSKGVDLLVDCLEGRLSRHTRDELDPTSATAKTA